MSDIQVSIGQVKRNISKLVQRVANAGERIVLTSRGEPQAALVSLIDYQRLQQNSSLNREQRWQAWLAEANLLTEEILNRREGQPFELDTLWDQVKADQETRDERLLGR